MLTFNQLLKTAGLDATEVRLARHSGQTPMQQRQIRDAAVGLKVDFQRYQERQRNKSVIEQFRVAHYIAGFVAEPLTKATVFVGIWKRLGERAKLVGDPISLDASAETPGIVEFETDRLPAFDPYVGRLVVEWGDGARAWVQRADNQDKNIIELRKHRSDPDFPGFARFKCELGDVEALYGSWSSVLRHARGVYLLVHRESGQQYVGSAVGADGFYGRWVGYNDGHGGNVAMKELKAGPAAFDATVLEVAGSSDTESQIWTRESDWKDKLGSRTRGLNRN